MGILSNIKKAFSGEKPAAAKQPSYTREQYLAEGNQMVEQLTTLFGTDSPKVIFDIGACEGLDSILYSKGFPESVVYCFEPIPSNFDRITENLKSQQPGKILPFQLALSDSEGVATFHVSSGHPPDVEKSENWDYGNKSSSLLPPDEHKGLFPHIEFNEAIEVKTTTLEKFCAEANIAEIDFAHLDVQGAELRVLSGAGSFIEKIKSIWLEVSNVSLYKNQPLKNDIANFFAKAGFHLAADEVDKLYGDQLWLNKRFFEK